jgi:two-component system cell cycle sensor histidine kinase/response regulator CckA
MMPAGEEARTAVLESWLNALFATSAAAMAVVSTFEGRYVRANAAMVELLGISLEELLSSDPFAIGHRTAHPDDLAAEQQLFAELVTGARSSYRLEKRFVRADGSFRWGLLTFSVIHAESNDPATPVGPIQYAVLHVIDVTEQRATAEALARREQELLHAQRVDGIGRLAAGIAHDFNNLLTVITGHGTLLQEHLGGGKSALPGAVENLDAILDAADRAANLTAQILAHGRREPVNPRSFQLSEAVDALRRLLARTIGSNIELEPSLAATGTIFADQGQVGQVVMNLTLNARDAMPEGGRVVLGTVDVTVPSDVPAGSVPGPGEWVSLVVSDTGHGMTPEVQARMFEPFFTTRDDRHGTQGTGLGLSTVRRVVADLGGRIAVHSVLGEGTRVTVYFPRVAASAGSMSPAPYARVARPAASGQHVLVVEDEASVRALVASVLLGAAYRVTAARNADDAQRQIDAASEPIALVITDLVMSGGGGTKLARVLSGRPNPPRFLFMSGYSNLTPAELLPYGTLLAKPFTPAQLLSAVAQALAGSLDEAFSSSSTRSPAQS